MHLVTLGVGAARSPRYRPAGLLVAHRGVRVIIDGGPEAAPKGRIDAWLLTDEHAELAAAIRARAGATIAREGGRISCRRPVRRTQAHRAHAPSGLRL